MNPIAVGYGLLLKDRDLLNDTGSKLAEMAFDSGLNNIGVIYFESNQNTTTIKVSLRSSNKYFNNSEQFAEEIKNKRCQMLDAR